MTLPSLLHLEGTVQDELPLGDPRLTARWSQVSGPAEVSFVTPSAPVTDVVFFVPGTYVLRLEANDSLVSATDFVTVVVDPQPSLEGAALVLTSSSAGPLTVGSELTLTASLLDANGQPMRDFPVQFAVNGANTFLMVAPTDAAGLARFTYTGARAETDQISATALGTASSLNAALPPFVWTPARPGGAAPQVTQGSIGSPLHQASVTGSVPIVVGAGVTVASGSIDYWPLAQPDNIDVLATSVAGGPGATLATLDTTVLLNGVYVIRLTAPNDAGDDLASLVEVTVGGDFKPGRLTASTTDFTVPLVGFPITIGRTYDSLERDQVGDFGNGWSLSLGDSRLEEDSGHNVTLTEPSGRRVTFNFTPTSFGSFFNFLFMPVYTPEPGVFGTLSSDGCPILVQSGGRIVCYLSSTQEYTPTVFTYKDPFGRVFTIGANGKLSSIQDLNGNLITLGPAGITSSAGGVTVPFERDGLGRITRITDLVGNAYQYRYDAAGDLVAVDVPTGQHTYSYDGAHLLVTAQDPNGNAPISSTYDADGRLESTTDAVGNVTEYAYDVPNGITTITNPDGGTVVQRHDPTGLLLSETDPLGRTTTFNYDDRRLKIREVNPAGEGTDFTYDEAGRETSRKDAAGRISRTSYNSQGQPVSSTDPLGNVFTIEYDEKLAPARFRDASRDGGGVQQHPQRAAADGDGCQRADRLPGLRRTGQSHLADRSARQQDHVHIRRHGARDHRARSAGRRDNHHVHGARPGGEPAGRAGDHDQLQL